MVLSKLVLFAASLKTHHTVGLQSKSTTLISLTANLYYACYIKLLLTHSYCILSPCVGLRSVNPFNKRK